MKMHDWQADKLMKVAKMAVVLKMSVVDRYRQKQQGQLIELIPCARIHINNHPSMCLPVHWQIVEDVEITEIVLTGDLL